MLLKTICAVVLPDFVGGKKACQPWVLNMSYKYYPLLFINHKPTATNLNKNQYMFKSRQRCLIDSWLIISNNLLKKLYSSISYYQGFAPAFGRSNISYKISKNQVRYSFNNKNTFYLNPDYITGFVDGEGCFSVSIFKDSRRLTGWQVKPIFSISLHNKDLNLLEAIQRTFNVGKIYKHGIDSIQYRVSSLNDLQVIIDHFDKYPLITQKQADYILFKQAINLIYNKEHLSSTGLLKIVRIKSALNWGLPVKF